MKNIIYITIVITLYSCQTNNGPQVKTCKTLDTLALSEDKFWEIISTIKFDSIYELKPSAKIDKLLESLSDDQLCSFDYTLSKKLFDIDDPK